MPRVACLFPAFAMRYSDAGRADVPGFADAVGPLLDRAIKVVDIDLRKFESPDRVVLPDELEDDLQAQYACYIDNCAAAALLSRRFRQCDYVAGYSMGLFSALHYCGVVSFEDGLLLTRDICRLAHAAVADGKWGMGAVMGLTIDEVQGVVAARAPRAEISDRCGKRVFILSGVRGDVEEVLDGCIEFGAMNARLLPVSLPFHCSLLASVEAPIRDLVQSVVLHAPVHPFVSAITQQTLTTVDAVRQELACNVSHSMNWYATMQKLLACGVNQMYECGLSDSLTNIASRNVRGKYAMQHPRRSENCISAS
jgi:malonyl CoA-acyl carrier protein transacylase